MSVAQPHQSLNSLVHVLGASQTDSTRYRPYTSPVDVAGHFLDVEAASAEEQSALPFLPWLSGRNSLLKLDRSEL